MSNKIFFKQKYSEILLFSKNIKAFTLVEILVTMSIFMIIVFMSSNFLTNSFKNSRFISEQDDAVTNARRALDVSKKEIRGANSSEQGDYALATIEDDNFIFYSDVDNDGEMEKIRYYLVGTDLIKQLTEPGPSKDYTLAPSSQTISHFMNNQEESVFTYYDSNYNETSLINEVRLIKINLKINVTPTISPNDYYVETDITLRNLKDNL